MMRSKLLLLMFLPLIGFAAPKDSIHSDKGVIINGLRWATRNVDKPGTFVANPEDVGMFYQWNSKKAWKRGGSVKGWRKTLLSDTIWTEKNNPCPKGWRLPTVTELNKLIKPESKWKVINDRSGRLFGEAPNQIFLPETGYYRCNGVYGTYFVNSPTGHYWSANVSRISTYNDRTTLQVHRLDFRTDDSGDIWDMNDANDGCCIRCVQDLSKEEKQEIQAQQTAWGETNYKTKDYLLWNKQIGVVIGMVLVVVMLFFLIKAFRCGKWLFWFVITWALVVGVQAPYYVFLPAVPGLLISYGMLYGYNSDNAESVFIKCTIGCLVVLSIYTLYTEGFFWGILYVIMWCVTSVLVVWHFYSNHIDKSVCKHCGKYAWHIYLSEDLVKRDIVRSQIHQDNYKRTTTERRGNDVEVTDWYRRKYGVRVERWEYFDVFHECVKCGRIFKSSKITHKSKDVW
jgi:uncharacterized protein (TIGR02145 family)